MALPKVRDAITITIGSISETLRAVLPAPYNAIWGVRKEEAQAIAGAWEEYLKSVPMSQRSKLVAKAIDKAPLATALGTTLLVVLPRAMASAAAVRGAPIGQPPPAPRPGQHLSSVHGRVSPAQAHAMREQARADELERERIRAEVEQAANGGAGASYDEPGPLDAEAPPPPLVDTAGNFPTLDVADAMLGGGGGETIAG